MAVNCGCEAKDSKQPGLLICDELLVFHRKLTDSNDDLNKDRCKLVIMSHPI
jgi:hypothetical protein